MDKHEYEYRRPRTRKLMGTSAMAPESPALPGDLFASQEQYLEVSSERLHSIVSPLSQSETFSPPKTEIRFHHLKFHADQRPKVRELANLLVCHLLQFCLSERRYRRGDLNLANIQEATNEARRMLRRTSKAGDAGEMLLYFLMESVLGAPQVVCKMEVKGSSGAEVLGSDGIHLRWDKASNLYDIFFGESKLEQTASAAVRHAARSIESFHKKERKEKEIKLVTAQFKYLDPVGQAIAADLAHASVIGAGLRTNHACLIGFDSKHYDAAIGDNYSEMEADFIVAYTAEVSRLRGLIEKSFSPLKWTSARFEIFVLPFPSVEQFRKEFESAVAN